MIFEEKAKFLAAVLLAAKKNALPDDRAFQILQSNFFSHCRGAGGNPCGRHPCGRCRGDRRV